jgi:prepilin-type processing-associated H-X9-DG protein
MELAVRYDHEVILAYDGLPNDIAASDNSEYFTVGCYVTNRHNGMANYLFGDGHVAAMQSTALTNNWFLK